MAGRAIHVEEGESDHHVPTVVATDDDDQFQIVMLEPPPDRAAAEQARVQQARTRMVRRRETDEEEEMDAERHLAMHQRLMAGKAELEARLKEVNRQLEGSMVENREHLDRLIARRQAISTSAASDLPATEARAKAKRAPRTRPLTAIP
eukprot:5866131-Amphidinium_carterae.1